MGVTSCSSPWLRNMPDNPTLWTAISYSALLKRKEDYATSVHPMTLTRATAAPTTDSWGHSSNLRSRLKLECLLDQSLSGGSKRW